MTSLVGTTKLVRLILRRDRWLLPLWIGLLAIVVASFVSATTELFPTAADRVLYARTSGTNTTFLALYGPLYSTSVGGIVAQRAGAYPIITGLVALLTVIRHTRTEEDVGRRELLGATVVGRHAALAAALLVALGANLALATLVGLGVSSQDQPAAGAWALGLSFALGGWVFAAVGAVAAQMTSSAGSARALALSALGAAFVVRVAGDVGGADRGGSWLSWLSPIGWSHRLRAFADEQWWVLGLGVGLVAALVAAAAALESRRDLGAGLLPARLGPAEGPPFLRSSLALAWRLHRSLLVGWAVGFAVLGLIYGSIAEGVLDLITDNPELEDLFARIGGQTAIVDAYLASILGVMALIASAYAIQATLKLRSEETALRAEPVLATSVGRVRWATGHLVFSLLGPSAVMTVGGVTAGLIHGLNRGDVGRELPRVFAGALVHLPAVWILAGLALALFGLVPRAAAGAWGAFALFVLLGQVGAVLQLDQWLLDVSPFTHIPRIPGTSMSATPLFTLVGITAALVAGGLIGFRRRDVG